MRSSSEHSTRLATRLLSALALVVFALCDFGGFAHLALHRHVVCADHGTVEHGGAIDRTHAPHRGPSTACAELDTEGHLEAEAGPSDDAPRGPSFQAASDDERVHEACSAWRATRIERAAAPPPASFDSVRVLTPLVGVAPATCAQGASDTRWLLAPKHSPPAAA